MDITIDDEDEPQYGYCQNCGDWIDGINLYATVQGDVYCRECGKGVDEVIESLDDEEAEAWAYMAFDPYYPVNPYTGEPLNTDSCDDEDVIGS